MSKELITANKELSEVNDVLGYMRSLSVADMEMLDKSEVHVSEWANYWLTNFCGNLKPNTAAYYHSATEKHINRVLGDILLTELTPEAVQMFVNSLQMGVGTPQPLSPKSIKNIHGILHKCLDVAARYKYIDSNPSTQIVLPYIPHKTVNVMTIEMLVRFMEIIKGNPKERLYQFIIFTGLRESETIGLTWDCIDFNRGSIHVHRQYIQDRKTRKFRFAPLKNNKSRVIYPSEYVMEMLAEMKKTTPETEENFVFVNKTNNSHYTIAAIYKSFKRIVKKMGYPKLRVHDLRHTYAVLCLLAGDDIKSLQSNLGHYSSAFTLDVYGHFTIDMQKKSAKKMSAFIQEVFPEFSGH